MPRRTKRLSAPLADVTQTLHPDHAADLARQHLDDRVDAVRQTAQALAEREQRRLALEDADVAYLAAWNAAVKRGWTERELTAIGLDRPGATAKRKPRRRPAPPAAIPGSGDERE